MGQRLQLSPLRPPTRLPLRKLQKLKQVSRSGVGRSWQRSPLLSSAGLHSALRGGRRRGHSFTGWPCPGAPSVPLCGGDLLFPCCKHLVERVSADGGSGVQRRKNRREAGQLPLSPGTPTLTLSTGQLKVTHGDTKQSNCGVSAFFPLTGLNI